MIREDLCEDAMRLCFLIIQNNHTSSPDAKALMALMCLQSARFNARTNSSGQIVLLKNQDRTLWHKRLICQGYTYLEQASEEAFKQNQFTKYSVYHIEAAIASFHTSASSFEATNWLKIIELYEALYQLQPNNIVAMNWAVALANAKKPQEALDLLFRINGLGKSHIYHTVIGEIYSETFDFENAKKHFQIALSLNVSEQERELILEKVALCA